MAGPLRARGHDVRAADEERPLDGTEDEQLLRIAAQEDRILVTFDVKDLTLLARDWARAGRAHAGIVIVVGMRTNDFGALISCLEKLFRHHPGEWTDLVVFASAPVPPG